MSSNIKPRILVDMDGPLAAFDRHFFDTAVSLGGPGVFDIENLSEQKHRFLTDHMPDKGHAAMMRHIVNETRWFRDLPVTRGAAYGMKTLAEVADVWICTKPLEVSASCNSDKLAWVKRHFPDFVERLIIAPNKSLVSGTVLLDDAIKPEWVDMADWRPVVFDEPFNGPGTKHGSDWARFSWMSPVSELLALVPGYVSPVMPAPKWALGDWYKDRDGDIGMVIKVSDDGDGVEAGLLLPSDNDPTGTPFHFTYGVTSSRLAVAVERPVRAANYPVFCGAQGVVL